MKLLILLLLYGTAFAKSPPPSDSTDRLLVMHPVNLKTGKVDTALGASFRKTFSKVTLWQVIPLTEVNAGFAEYSVDINNPCKELNCAFDAGNILQAQYSLYSTVTLFENFYIFSLNLVDNSITKVVWSENGEVLIKSGDNPEAALLHRLSQLLKNLSPEDMNRKKTQTRGTLGILNLSGTSDYSRILFERLSTHAYTSGQYDLVSSTELAFILESISIQPDTLAPNHETMIPLGGQLGVDYLIFVHLKKNEKKFELKLALYDIRNKRLEREWPYKSSNYRKLLKFVDKFFSNLTRTENTPGVVTDSATPKWKWLAAPIALAAGGALSYLAWREHRHGNDEYRKWESSDDTVQELEQRPGIEENVKDSRLKRNIYGSAGALFLGGSLVVIAF